MNTLTLTQHWEGNIAGVSVSVIAFRVLLAAAVAVMAIVVYLVRKKVGPQSRGFTRLSTTNTEVCSSCVIQICHG